MTTNVVEGSGQSARRGGCEELAQLDDEIMALLERRRDMVATLPVPSGPRATDPSFTSAVRRTTDRYSDRLGAGGELVARAVLLLCGPGERV